MQAGQNVVTPLRVKQMKNDRTAYLHIGTHKTGTTAIQEFLDLNQKSFLKNGFLIPTMYKNAVGQRNLHHYIAINFGFGKYNIEPNPGKVYKTIIDELERVGKDKLILSSEIFLESATPYKIRALKELFNNFNVKIIIYLRRQDHMIESVYGQTVKDGGCVKFKGEKSYRLDYYEILMQWAEVFGHNNIIVRAYEREQFVSFSLFADFLSILEIENNNEYVSPQKDLNPRLSLNCQEFKRLINAIYNDRQSANEYNELLFDYSVKECPETTKAFAKQNLLSPRQCNLYVDMFSESNKNVAHEFMRRGDGSLFYEKQNYAPNEWVPYAGLSQEKAIDILQYIYRSNKELVYKLARKILINKDVSGEFAEEAVSIVLPWVERVLENDINLERLRISSSVVARLDKGGDIHGRSILLVNVLPENFLMLVRSINKEIVDVAIHDNCIELKAIGGDPHFVIKCPECEYVLVEVSLHTPIDTMFELFYQARDDLRFNRKKSKVIAMKSGHNLVQFLIDDDKFNGVIRIDPGMDAGVYKIEYIKIIKPLVSAASDEIALID